MNLKSTIKICLIISCFYSYNIYGQQGDTLYKTHNYIDINQMLMWVGNNGEGSHNIVTDGSGLYWPGGTNATKTLVYQDGLVWGFRVNGDTVVNGNTHRQGLQPGIIMEDGTPADSTSAEYNIYKIKKGWESLPPSAERDRYENDYNNWPVQNGAPWVDVDNDGSFTIGTDLPDYVGDEALFYVANDLNPVTSAFTYGSAPAGLEQQCTIYGYDRTGTLGDVVFKKYKIINKSQYNWEEMFLSYWYDDDLGDAGDDYSGYDSINKMGYTYNGDAVDGMYNIPPAVGHMLLQGPIVQSFGDTAIYNGHYINNYKNIPVTSHAFYINGSVTYQDPTRGLKKGTHEFYNYMQGRVWNGNPFIDPNTNIETKITLAGNPIDNTGWYEGEGWPGGPVPDDRRALLSSGPFTLAAGDTQEVVVAIIAAQGVDRLGSVIELRNAAVEVRDFYNSGILTSVDDNVEQQLNTYKLKQNYPNPFNPSTKIVYSLAEAGNVKLSIYNALGEQVKVLKNEYQSQGNYNISFDASDLTSGVYFYRIQSGSFIQTKKMVLLK